MAVMTRPWAPALFTGALASLAAVFAEYNLPWSDAQVAGLGGIILAGFALFGIRPQATPRADQAPISPANGQIR
jgi:hypothetical protein